VKRCAHKVMHENLAIAEDILDGREWFFDDFTIPDAYFFWCFRRAKQFELDVAVYANCNAHFDRVSRRPSVTEVLAFERETLAAFSP